MIQTVNREKYTLVTTQVRRDLNLDNSTLTLTRENFDIAFIPFFQTPVPGVSIDTIEEYFSVKIGFASLAFKDGFLIP